MRCFSAIPEAMRPSPSQARCVPPGSAALATRLRYAPVVLESLALSLLDAPVWAELVLSLLPVSPLASVLPLACVDVWSLAAVSVAWVDVVSVQVLSWASLHEQPGPA
jgi:hypothetical protein